MICIIMTVKTSYILIEMDLYLSMIRAVTEVNYRIVRT